MKIDIRSSATASIIFISLLSSCGKKDESPATETPPAQTATSPAKPQPAPPAPPPAPEKSPAQPGTVNAKNLSGTIGGQPVVMQLSFAGDGSTAPAKITGSYFIEAQGTGNTVSLSGMLQDGSLTMDQSVEGKVTAVFELTNDQANKNLFLGSWKGQGRVLPVRLTVTP